jgi:hypothetical protein
MMKIRKFVTYLLLVLIAPAAAFGSKSLVMCFALDGTRAVEPAHSGGSHKHPATTANDKAGQLASALVSSETNCRDADLSADQTSTRRSEDKRDTDFDNTLALLPAFMTAWPTTSTETAAIRRPFAPKVLCDPRLAERASVVLLI